MFITAKRNLLLPSPDGSQKYFVPRGFLGNIPDWTAETAYFAALVRDGKISLPEGKGGKQIEAALEKPVRRRKAAEAEQEG